MPNYIVARREIHISYVSIGAETEEQAIEKVENEEGEEFDTEYERALGSDSWTVKEE